MKHLKTSLKVLFLIGIIFMSFAATAQVFTYGVKAGLNIPSLKFTDADFSSKTVLGVHAGFFVNYAINEKLAIQPELFYSTRGTKYTYSFDVPNNAMARIAAESNIDGQLKTNSVTLPVMLQYKIINGLYIEAGPQYNFLLSITEAYDGSGYKDIKEYYKSGTFGVGIGAGYDLASFAAGLKVGLRYTKDISEMNGNELRGGTLKSSMLQIGLAYAFGI